MKELREPENFIPVPLNELASSVCETMNRPLINYEKWITDDQLRHSSVLDAGLIHNQSAVDLRHVSFWVVKN